MPLVFPRTEQRAAMTAQPMRTVDVLQSSGSEFTARDDTVNGFRVRVRPTARPPVRRYTIAGGRQNHTERAGARQGHIVADPLHRLPPS